MICNIMCFPTMCSVFLRRNTVVYISQRRCHRYVGPFARFFVSIRKLGSQRKKEESATKKLFWQNFCSIYMAIFSVQWNFPAFSFMLVRYLLLLYLCFNKDECIQNRMNDDNNILLQYYSIIMYYTIIIYIKAPFLFLLFFLHINALYCSIWTGHGGYTKGSLVCVSSHLA